ncbi:Transposon Ty3-G Gag-Pol polyprotein, partial [Aduncisulcus paluster]
ELVDESQVVTMHPRRIRQQWKDQVRQQVEEEEANGITRKSLSPFCSAIVVVPKPHEKLRVCVDYRELNKNTVGMGYPLPRIDDLLSDME